ncbi:HPr kinase/phosphorylase [Bartonella tamiae]|uniref:HPr kinase/phosphorylase C-terminal domain-containing protein n=1 Tax=Bartonella tamiae Th239 TaxID=1094558 RepID=J0ZR18_9HYPH|nr:hypothetical protein [Bartonella tamiae]EJF91128.1 hypothetical protein ME5_00460 [Bartonella tamiae Th239]EJF93207.1 hypothetical protein MEG_01421 [Bartonella tamiae Th307]
MNQSSGRSLSSQTLHANCLQLDDKGVLITGSSGSGKSVVSLSLIERAQWSGRQACLVSDDYTEIKNEDGMLYGLCPQTLKGGIEIRGAGLYSLNFIPKTRLSFIIDLSCNYERLPSGRQMILCGVSLPLYALPSLQHSDSVAICQAIEAFCFGKVWKNPA